MTETAARKPTIAMHPDPDDGFDLDRMRELAADRTLVDLREIAQMAGTGHRQNAFQWQKACQNYFERGFAQWPPTPEVLRGHAENTGGVPLESIPAHPRVLPRPANLSTAAGSRSKLRWYRGDIIKWLWQTRRATPEGEPLLGVARFGTSTTGPNLPRRKRPPS